jgi:hypothetical protein
VSVDQNYKIDTRWAEYTPPASAVSELAQQPLYKIDGLALSDAVMRDWRTARNMERITAEMHAEARRLLAGRPKRFTDAT